MTEPRPFAFADAFGPEKVIEITDPRSFLRAALVVDNTAAGPAIGGCRMARDVSVAECARLARAMTLKNAAAGLPHGGAKSVIFADPRQPRPDKERLIRAFARAIAQIEDYVPGPDMGTDETAMAWIRDETGRAVGLPATLGGIPLDEIGATGRGLAAAARAASEATGMPIEGARVAIQGYGAVGRWAARFLRDMGAVIVAVSDSRACVSDAGGLDIEKLEAVKAHGQALGEAEAARIAPRDTIFGTECEILIPAARPDAINRDNVDRVRARLVLEGANIPATAAAEAALHDRGVIVVPDFIANAGGVICAAMERAGRSRSEAEARIEEMVHANTYTVLDRARAHATTPRAAARALAEERVREAMSYRR